MDIPGIFDFGASLFLVPIFALFVVGALVWIWGLVDAIRVSDDSLYQSGNKLIWVLVIVFTGFIGSIIYFAIGKPRSPRLTPS